MKLKKFNEDINDNFDIEYFENCFVDFIYDNNNNYIGKSTDNEWHIQVFFITNVKRPTNYENYYVKNIKDVIEYNKEIFEIYEDINVAIEKIKIKYPNIKTKFEFTWNTDQNFKFPISIGIFLTK